MHVQHVNDAIRILKNHNAELRELAKQFFKEMRCAISEHYGATGAAGTAPATAL